MKSKACEMMVRENLMGDREQLNYYRLWAWMSRSQIETSVRDGVRGWSVSLAAVQESCSTGYAGSQLVEFVKFLDQQRLAERVDHSYWFFYSEPSVAAEVLAAERAVVAAAVKAMEQAHQLDEGLTAKRLAEQPAECGACRWWDPKAAPSKEGFGRIGECYRWHHGQVQDKACYLVVDDDDACAELVTGSGFSCALFEVDPDACK